MKALNADKLNQFLSDEDFRDAYQKMVHEKFDNGKSIVTSGKITLEKLDWEELKKRSEKREKH